MSSIREAKSRLTLVTPPQHSYCCYGRGSTATPEFPLPSQIPGPRGEAVHVSRANVQRSAQRKPKMEVDGIRSRGSFNMRPPSPYYKQGKRSHAGARGDGQRSPIDATALFTCCRDDSGTRERGPAGRYGEVAERLGAIRQVHCGNVMRCMCQYARHASSRRTLLYTAMIRSCRYLASASSA